MDLSLFSLRAAVGLVLITGGISVLMDETVFAACVAAWDAINIAQPSLFAVGSISIQVMTGGFLLLGLATKAVGLVAMVNYLIASLLKYEPADAVSAWPAILVVLICAHFAVRGACRMSVDDRFISPANSADTGPSPTRASAAEESDSPIREDSHFRNLQELAPKHRKRPGLY